MTMRRLLRPLAYAILLMYFSAGFVVVNVLMIGVWMAGPGGPARVRAFSGVMLRHFMRCTARLHAMRVTMPDLRTLRGHVIVANHPSIFDALTLIAANSHTLCFFKSTLRRTMLGLPGAQLADYLPNDSGVAGLLLAARRIRAGANVLIFPEGTRSRGPAMNPFGKSAAVLAMKTGAPVTCLVYRYSEPFLSKERGIFSPPAAEIRITATPAGILFPADFANADALNEAMRTTLERALAQPQ